MHKEIGIFVNPASQTGYKRAARDLSLQLQTGEPRELTFPLDPIPEEIETSIVFGGDGTVKGIMEALLQRGSPGLLVVVPAGSQNGLWHALTDKRSTLNVEQLQSSRTAHIPLYVPGSMHGEIFNHLSDATKAGTEQLRWAETIRPYVPRIARAYAAVALAYVAIRNGEDFPSCSIRTLMPTPYIGTKKVFPQQEIYGDDVTLVSLDAENKLQGAAKMGLFVFYLLVGKHPPKQIAEITTAKSFTVNVYSQKFNVDGEMRTLPNRGTIFVARHHRSLQVAAYSPEK